MGLGAKVERVEGVHRYVNDLSVGGMFLARGTARTKALGELA